MIWEDESRNKLDRLENKSPKDAKPEKVNRLEINLTELWNLVFSYLGKIVVLKPKIEGRS